jgi:hypothetical protein
MEQLQAVSQIAGVKFIIVCFSPYLVFKVFKIGYMLINELALIFKILPYV